MAPCFRLNDIASKIPTMDDCKERTARTQKSSSKKRQRQTPLLQWIPPASFGSLCVRWGVQIHRCIASNFVSTFKDRHSVALGSASSWSLLALAGTSRHLQHSIFDGDPLSTFQHDHRSCIQQSRPVARSSQNRDPLPPYLLESFSTQMDWHRRCR